MKPFAWHFPGVRCRSVDQSTGRSMDEGGKGEPPNKVVSRR